MYVLTKEGSSQIDVYIKLQHTYSLIRSSLSSCSLIDDIYSERLTKLNMRKSLEQSWNSSIEEKHKHLLDELSHAKQPSKLLHQQCEKYHRYGVI